MTSQLRVQVVGLLSGDLRSILWIRQDQSAIRCGLYLRGTDLHATLREGEGTHLSGKGEADIVAAVTNTPWSSTLDPKNTEQIACWAFSDLKADFQKFPLHKDSTPASLVTLDLASLPRDLDVRVHITNSNQLFLPQLIASMEARMIHVDTSSKPKVVVLVGTAQ